MVFVAKHAQNAAANPQAKNKDERLHIYKRHGRRGLGQSMMTQGAIADLLTGIK